MDMIKKTILTSLVLLIMYSVFVEFAPEWWNASQNQWQENVVKAQHFIYDKNSGVQNVILGTSLSYRMINDSLPDTYNLSFSGESVLTGLAVLTHKTELPKNVFIEMNVVMLPENKELTKTLYTPVIYKLKKRLICLREDKQPLAVIGKIQVHIIERIKSILNPKRTEMVYKQNDSDNESLIYNKMVNIQVVEYSKAPDDIALEKSFAALKKYVIFLEEKDINIIFYEVPVNHMLQNLPRAKIIREKFKEYFPVSKYHYIPLPSSMKCETTDGLHLKKNEAIQYTSYFKSEYKNCFIISDNR
jgi:hypothetical protein